MTQNPSQGMATCSGCGTQSPADARFCPSCGRVLDTTQAPSWAPPVAPAPLPPAPAPGYPQPQGYGQPPTYSQPQAYGSVPAYPPGQGYAPALARRSRLPIFVGLGAIGLVLVFIVGALLGVGVGGGGQAPTGTFSPTGSMAAGRYHHTATLLSDGRVLVAGGYRDPSNVLASAELYDPKTGTFSPTGSMATARADHTATLLSDGRVLIAGGWDGSTYPTSAELYDPKTGTFSPTGSMAAGRYHHTATLLSDGRVLVAGGGGSPHLAYPTSAELYDPKTGTFSATGSMATGRVDHTATLLSDGRVLIAGGWDGSQFHASDDLAELYDPAPGKFSPTGSMATGHVD
ncbi:MAG: kelch repeat-containing protein, partial [Candidatus Limnocylindrales bacterium]